MPTRKQAAETRATQIDQLLESGSESFSRAKLLIDTARDENDHEVLGIPWASWVAERAKHLKKLDLALRQGLVEELTAMGQTTREIAAQVGVSHKTVIQDQQRAAGTQGSSGAATINPRSHYRPNVEEAKRRQAEVVRLWKLGVHRTDICDKLGISHGVITSDLRAAGITAEEAKRPVADQKPRGAKVKVKEWRDKQDDDHVVVYLKTKPPQCELDALQVDKVIKEVDQALTDLENYDALTGAQVDKLVEILSRTIDAVLAREAERK
jgi:DNA-binding CsgD family transcriptional regulator